MSDAEQRPTAASRPAAAKYRMRISRLTIDQLGIRLYDRVAAVLAELIANAYDAEAENVTISLPFETLLASVQAGELLDHGYEIRIEDNGVGMTSDEVNAHYLEVGANRRATRGERTQAKGRLVMGRKGIGKLAPFGICREVEVITAGGPADDAGSHAISHLILRYDEIVGPGDDDYFPSVGSSDGLRAERTGTTIILRRFGRKRVPDGESLHRQLAARFGVRQPDWSVRLVDSRPDGATVALGDLAIAELADTRLDVAGRPVPFETGDLPVSGWVAYAADPYKDEAMAGVRIFARGKLVAQTRDFDIPAGFTGEFKLRSYIVGEINADWLDDTEDLVRSDRQDIIWNSDKGEALRAWGRRLIREIAARAETSVRAQTWEEFVGLERLEERLELAAPTDREMRDSIRLVARLLVSRADRESIRDADYRGRLFDLAFAVGPHRTLVDALAEAAADATTTLAMVVELFRRASVAEIYSLGQVARERVDTVAKLAVLIRTEETQERQLQLLIERAPWLIHPEWTPLAKNERLERARAAFESWYERVHGVAITTSAIQHPEMRPDFIMISDRGLLEIVEIKRPGHDLADEEMGRAYQYLEDMRTFLAENTEIAEEFRLPTLTIVCDGLRLRSGLANAPLNDRAVSRRTWEELLSATRRSHQDFLDQIPDKALLNAPATVRLLGEGRERAEPA